MRTELTAPGAKILRRRRQQAENRQDLLGLVLRVLALAVAGVVLFSQVFLIIQAPDNDMFPAVKDGDLLIGYRLQRRFVKNDVVVYRQEGRTRVGRILGVAGDMIMLDDSGTLLVNGAAQSGEILYPTYPRDTGENAGNGGNSGNGGALTYPYTVPQDCVFVLGDYRTQSRDSRDFGAVPLSDIQGKVISLLRRRTL